MRSEKFPFLFVWPLIALLASCADKGSFIERAVGDESLVNPGDTDDAGNDARPERRRKEDHFTQGPNSRMDILWVLDNSASMVPFQSSLTANIGHFLDRAAKWRGDVRMAVTSTDMCPAIRPGNPAMVLCPERAETIPGLQGRFSGNKVIRGLDSAAAAEFRRVADIGANGSSFEHGLSAAKRSLELAVDGVNPEFLRSDAYLAVIVVSDEQDDGVGLGQFDERGINWFDEGLTTYRFTARDLVSYLRKIKPDGNFSVTSIVGQTGGAAVNSGCVGGATIEAGSEQILASTLTGGANIDICDRSWAVNLMRLADHLASANRGFHLNSVPSDPSSIRVFVSGRELTRGWVYVPASNIIMFDLSHIPAQNERILVQYL
jgi:hypothetical protein